jgi:hypothetical protein
MMPKPKKASSWRGDILLTPDRITIQKRTNHGKSHWISVVDLIGVIGILHNN